MKRTAATTFVHISQCVFPSLYLNYEVLVDGSQLTRKVWCSIKEKIMNVIDRFSCLAGHLGLQNQQQSIYLSAPHLGRLACRHADFPGTFLRSSRVLRAVPTHILSSAQGLWRGLSRESLQSHAHVDLTGWQWTHHDRYNWNPEGGDLDTVYTSTRMLRVQNNSLCR